MMGVKFGQVLGPDPAENFDEFLSCPFRAPAIWLGCGGCLMGFFIYDNEREIRVDDRILAHLQIVIIDKLRRSESFELHLRSDSVVVSMWLTRWRRCSSCTRATVNPGSIGGGWNCCRLNADSRAHSSCFRNQSRSSRRLRQAQQASPSARQSGRPRAAAERCWCGSDRQAAAHDLLGHIADAGTGAARVCQSGSTLVASCGAPTGLDSDDPRWRRYIESAIMLPTARNSDCQFCSVRFQKSAPRTY